ncbi:hypothetical protein [Hyphomonas sp. GM-8P]|jgi:hypothetical protein|uniref:hypothetical protein n=1 Tax=Hyphomonas sp. GM-8P TaxID=1280945 RepID=UPI000DC017D9|nr:hypothetical protein [Hyphomonas sp. GM-8P]RAN39274.1 hypothetical protein HY26_16300 [Hyphomonas sp. GM-8P]
MKRVLCLSALGLAALATACSTPAETTQTAAANVGPNGEPLVCRNIKVTGTRFPQKECKTAEAWEQYDAYTNGNAKESTDKFQRIQSGASTNAGG